MREESMKGAAAVFPIALALGAMILMPRAGAKAQDAREEGPTEIKKCRTIDNPGSYKLVRNLTATGSADCLVITASFVTIDLAGFAITGGGSPGNGATGIRTVAPSSSSLSGIAVRNGSISGFFNAVDLSSADGSIVEALRALGFDDGVFASGTGISANGIVRGNTVSAYTGGISATGVVTGNSANRNFGGIFAGAGSTVIGNIANGNFRIGIGATCPINLTDNTAINNPFDLNLNGNGCHDEDNVTTAH